MEFHTSIYTANSALLCMSKGDRMSKGDPFPLESTLMCIHFYIFHLQKIVCLKNY